jgi:hypothetical protein
MNELEYNREESSGSESMLKAMQDQGATYREEDLATNLDWIEASGKVYQMNNNGEKFQGDYRALAKYGIDQMSEFNYNVAMGMIPDVLAVEKADPETQMSFAYLMDTYDKKDITLDGFGRAVKELALDPTTYLGISTLGAGFAVKKGAQQLAKEGLKNRLHNSIRNYLTSGLAVGATEGAIYSAGDTTAREMIQTDAGLREGVSGTDVAISGVIGAGVGAGLGKGIEVAGKAIGKGIDYLNKEGEQAMAQAAGGGVPPTAFLDMPIDNTRTRVMITKPRTPWHKDRIKKELRTLSSDSSPRTFRQEISRFKNEEELNNNIFYHGTSSGEKRLKPSIVLRPGTFEGGGYGEQYWGISLSKSRNIASNFTGSKSYGSVMPVLLKKDAKIKEMPEISDSVELEDHIEELWNSGVDAVKIGDWTKEFSEQEMVILNPKAIVTGKGTSFKVFQKEKFKDLTPEELIELHKPSEEAK